MCKNLILRMIENFAWEKQDLEKKSKKEFLILNFLKPVRLKFLEPRKMYICQFENCWFETCLLLYENYIFLEQCKQLIWNLMKTTF